MDSAFGIKITALVNQRFDTTILKLPDYGLSCSMFGINRMFDNSETTRLWS